MALLTPFCNLISLFSSISDDGTIEKALWDEIFGCVNYIKMPYETVMNKPVYLRHFWITKHNEAVEIENKEYNSGGESHSDASINSAAEIEQMKEENLRK